MRPMLAQFLETRGDVYIYFIPGLSDGSETKHNALSFMAAMINCKVYGTWQLKIS